MTFRGISFRHLNHSSRSRCKQNLMGDLVSRIIIIGASVRAAAWSALRAGLEPFCADMFADRDLRRVAAVKRISFDEYPGGFEKALADGPKAPWLYTGALENQPQLIECLARSRPLWGNGAATLRRVRSPFLVAEALQRANLPCPAVRRAPPCAGDSRRWLLKPRFGAGGRGIRFWDGQAEGRSLHSSYFQEWIDGESYAAVYCARGDGAAQLLGVTRQLVGLSWLNAAPFQYCGSVGPWPLTPFQQDQYRRLGNALAHAFALRGLFGVDCVVRHNVPLPVEINPRYTASMELVEWAARHPVLQAHAQAFEGPLTRGTTSSSPLNPNALFAKTVYYANRPMVFPEEGPWCDALAQPWQPWAMPDFADIPAPGQRFLPGEPVLTMFARGQSSNECSDLLRTTSLHIGDQLAIR
jgi:uncharacterized protein